MDISSNIIHVDFTNRRVLKEHVTRSYICDVCNNEYKYDSAEHSESQKSDVLPPHIEIRLRGKRGYMNMCIHCSNQINEMLNK